MEDTVKRINGIIKIIDIYSYISAFYELVIKHNIGIGIVLTIISLILSIAVYIMNNIDKLIETYNEAIDGINVPLFFKISIFVYILIWIIVLIAWLNMIGSVFTVIFLGFVLYNMPVLFSISTKILCYILQEEAERYNNISLIVSVVLSIILFGIFLTDMENGSIFYLILEVIFQCIPLYFAIEISQ